ncbi:MAG: DUF3127 domain-containing protein [Bacteroides sp.]|nr:DUF3127 domain-containing protein [Bacteroides sp.]
MAYKITGRILLVGQTESLTSKNGKIYQKRDLVITTMKYDPYTGQPEEDQGNTPRFTFFGERCQSIDGFSTGDTVCVTFDIGGRSWEKDGVKMYMTDVRPIRVDKVQNPGVSASTSFGQPQMTSPFPGPAPQAPAGAPFGQSSFGQPQMTSPVSHPAIPPAGDDLPF